MTRLFALLTTIFLAATPYFALAAETEIAEKKVIRVENFNSFLQAIAPNVEIILDNNIEIKFGEAEVKTIKNSLYLESNHNNIYKDSSLHLTLKNLQNFTITSSKNNYAIFSSDPTPISLKFSNVQNATLQNISLKSLSLTLENSSDFNFINSKISFCPINIATIINSENVNFNSASFSNSLTKSGSYGFNINNSKVIFRDALFNNLSNAEINSLLFLIEDKTSQINVRNSRFTDNSLEYFSNNSLQIGDQINLFDNIYNNNSFVTPSSKHWFAAASEKTNNKLYVHQNSLTKLYKTIPITLNELRLGKNISYASSVKFIKKEGEEVKVNNISGHWIYVDYKGDLGYVFDGFLSALPVATESKIPDLTSYYKTLQHAEIDANLEQKILGYFDEISQKYIFDLADSSLQFNSCNNKDVFWAFSSFNGLKHFSFPDKDAIKSLVKNKKLKKDEVFRDNGIEYYFDGNEISLTKNNVNFVITVDQNGEITSLENSFKNGDEITFAKQAKCLWQADVSKSF